jgi:enoyl-CoA hydratase/carnithine racemase
MKTRNDGSILVELHGSVAVMTLNRPAVRNAIDLPTRMLLLDLLSEADASDEIHAIVLTGSDPAFCGGVDRKALAATLADGPPPGMNPGQAVRAAATPLIAAVNGACVTGGFEIALSCDFIVASEEAVFADTHAKLGLTPGKGMWGMSALLPEAIGRRRAKELSLTGRFVAAPEALEIGLVSAVVPHDELVSVAVKVAQAVASAPPEAAQAWLEVYDQGAGRSLSERFEIESSAGGRRFPPVDA